MIKTFCDRCGNETTGEKHGAIHGIVDADDNGGGTNQAPDCFDIVCGTCFDAWRTWMQAQTINAVDPSAQPPGTPTPRGSTS